eukprot:4040567-Ditylum_brightwellii.AAC.1
MAAAEHTHAETGASAISDPVVLALHAISKMDIDVPVPQTLPQLTTQDSGPELGPHLANNGQEHSDEGLGSSSSGGEHSP